MSNLSVQTINSALVIDSRLIAEELGIEHRALRQLIRNNEVDFKEIDNLNISNVGVAGTSSYETFYYLTEDQCYLAVMQAKNTIQARQLKINIVKAFKSAREALQPKLPSNYKEALLALVAAEEEKEALASQVAEQAPKVQAFETFLDTHRDISMGEAAKVLAIEGLGRNNLFKKLRELKILMKNNLPYQRYVDAGYFVVVETIIPQQYFTSPQTMVTPKGLEFVRKLLLDNGYVSKKLAA